MTFFLPQQEQAPVIQSRNPAQDITGRLEGLAATTSLTALEHDANFRAAREAASVRDAMASEVSNRIELSDVIAYVQENGSGFDHIRTAPESYEELFNNYSGEATTWLLEIGKQRAAEDPEAWANVDFSDEAIDAEVNRRLQAEHAELSQIIDMMPEGQGFAEFVGGMAGITLDIKNLPFMFAGGPGGSFARVMGREALINMAAETAFLPSQFKMADRLNIPDPDIAQQLMYAAGGGAIFGGAFEALGRGARYVKARKTPPANMPPELAGLLDKAEDILSSDSPTPFDDIADLVTPREPDWDAMARGAEQPVDATGAPADFDEEAWLDSMEAAITESDKRMTYKHPLAQTIIRRGGVAYKRLNRATGDWVLTPVAQELEAMGITPKTHPFIWRKDGMADFDTLVASEFDGLDQVIPVDRATGYFEPQAMTRALGDELSSGRKTPMNGDIAAMMRQIDEGRPSADVSPARQFDDGYGIDLETYRLDHGPNADARIASDVKAYLQERGLADVMTGDELADLTGQMQTQGGFIDDYLDRMSDDILDRQAARMEGQEPIYDEIPWEDPVSARPAGQGQGAMGPGGQPADGPAASAGRQAGGGAGDAPALRTEPTAAGEQGLIEGVDPITARARLEARQNAPMRGGSEAATDGLFDVAGRSQGDMFDDPLSPQAKVAHDAIEADIRTGIENDGDFTVDMGDGKGVRSVTEVLDDIDRANDFADAIDLCGRAR